MFSDIGRFSEVAQLKSVCWLCIRAKFQLQMLSPKTTYAAYLVFKLSEYQFGLNCPLKASVQLVRENGSEVEGGEPTSIYMTRLRVVGHCRRRRPPRPQVNIQGGVSRSRWLAGNRIGRSMSRSDGWLEMELGQFFMGEGDNRCHVQLELSETEQLNWKRGLIVQGIELRPKEAFIVWRFAADDNLNRFGQKKKMLNMFC